MDNVFQHFADAAGSFPDRVAVELQRRGTPDITTYAELVALTARFAGALRQAGAGRGTRCAILADNDANWCGAYLGILRAGAIAVPLDTSYRPAQVATILADCGATVLFASAKYQPTAQAAFREMHEPPRLALLADIADRAATADDGPAPPSSLGAGSDTAVILYTSGTTSDPKGVMLTHGNLLAERDAAFKIVTVHERDSLLGVLPLFHALAQIANLLVPLTVGARVVFLETLNSAEMVRVLSECGITAFCVVPQFYYLIHQRVMERMAAAPRAVRMTFRTLLLVNGASRRWLRLNLGRLLFGRVHAAVGRSMRILVTGGSRFDPQVGRDLFNMGFNIIQAYGLTECAGAATATRQGDPHIDSVGQPFSGVQIRIKPAETGGPEREYPDGEVLIKGPIVMAGYYNKPEANAVTLQDGWLHTGDLGYVGKGGRLYITGRLKDVIVLASGKNIYPEEIEAAYLTSPYITEMCVMGIARPGEPSAERLHAIVVPDLAVMRDRRVVNMREAIRFDIEGLSLHLPHYKRVLSFDIWQDALPRTTTQKLKRHAIARLFAERSAAASGPAAETAWSEADQIWAADPHVHQALQYIRRSAKPGSVVVPEANLELDLGLDSMERVELLAALEHAFGASVPEADAQRVYTVRDLVEALRGTAPATAAEGAAETDPWSHLLARDSADPEFRHLLRSRRLLTPVMFTVVKATSLLARIFMGLRVSGRHHVPDAGAFLISPNHQSYLDAFLLVGTLPYRTYRRLFFVGASEYFTTSLLRRLARLINLIPVDPDANLVRAMQAGAFGLRHDKVLVLFPEGERSPDGSVRTFKKGASILATHLRVPIVPVAIHGVFEIWPRGKRVQWARLIPFVGARARVRYGPPLSPTPANGAAGSDRYARLTAALREAVASLWTALDRQTREA